VQLEPLLRFLLAQPFRRFDLFLTDGRRVPITHPESASVYVGGLGLWIVRASGQIEFIEGDAVASVRSAEALDPSDLIRE
jgi:hypothetical protein